MDARFDEVSKLVEALSPANKNCLEILRNLKGLVTELPDIVHFREIQGLQKLIDFVDVDGCQAIALSLIANCCTEKESSVMVLNGQTIYKIRDILGGEEQPYLLKSASRIVGILCLHRECHKRVFNVANLTSILVACLDKQGLDESFLSAHLKTISLMSSVGTSEILKQGVTCKLSKLLSHHLSSKLFSKILHLIQQLFSRNWESNFDTQENCRSTLKNLLEIMKDTTELSHRLLKFFLCHLVPIASLQPFMGPSGVLSFLLTKLQESKSRSYKHHLLACIYKILLEPVNRWHFTEEGGLELMLQLLRDGSMKPSMSLVLRTVSLFSGTPEHATYLASHKIVPLCIGLLEGDTSSKLAELTHNLLHADEEKDDIDCGKDLSNVIALQTLPVKRPMDLSTVPCSNDIPFKKIKLSSVDGSTAGQKSTDERSKSTKRVNLEEISLQLIYSLVRHGDAELQLNNQQAIDSLMHVLLGRPSHWCELIILHISKNPLFFKLFIKHMLIPMLELSHTRVTTTTMSASINNLDSICQSNFAPTILPQLLSDHLTTLQCAISLCYHARCSKVKRYMQQARMLEAVVSAMYDHKHPLQLLAINAYCYLLNSIGSAYECKVKEEEAEGEEDEDYDVRFIVGEECIRSRKSRLVCHSEVFRAMFEGSFSEASTGQVVITGTSSEAFHLFNQCLLSGHLSPLLLKVHNTALVLEVLQLANRYLVERLEERIVSLVCSDMPTYFEGVLKSNTFLSSRPLLANCILHASKTTLQLRSYKEFFYLLNVTSLNEFIELSTNLIKLTCS